MIHIIEGRPGSGKTYFVVSWILKRYYEYSDKFFEYIPKNSIPNIITNVREIKLANVYSLDNEVKKAGSIENFFALDDNGELKNEILKNSVLIIDEAQAPHWFHRKFYNPKVMYFFQLHRHFGIEIFLCTQDVKSLCPEIRELPEYHIKAARASLQMGTFRYQKFYDGEAGERSFLKKNKEVFDVYRSVEKGAEKVQAKSVLVRYAIAAILLVSLAVGSLFTFKWYFFGGHRKHQVKTTKQVVRENSTKKASVITEAEASEAPGGERSQAPPPPSPSKTCKTGEYKILDGNNKEIESHDIVGKCPPSDPGKPITP